MSLHAPACNIAWANSMHAKRVKGQKGALTAIRGEEVVHVVGGVLDELQHGRV